MQIKNQSPRVSVILPVYNGAEYLEQSIRSTLDQSFEDFELIVINDGSKDYSEQIVASFSDSRIKYVFQKNRGLAATLNSGIQLAKGEFIARQDQDDFSSPDRFLKQVEFFEGNPEMGMVGTWARIISSSGQDGMYHTHPTGYAAILFALLFDNPFVHSSVMVRKKVFDTVGVYSTDTTRQPPEDYELWSRVARRYPVGNLPEVLHAYRQVPSGMSYDRKNPFRDRMITISRENIAFFAGIKASDPVARAIAFLGNPSGGWNRLAPSLSRIQKALAAIRSSVSGLGNSTKVDLETWESTVEEICQRYFERHIAWRSARLLMRPKSLLNKIQARVRKTRQIVNAPGDGHQA